jgi:hypothetical protein
MVRPYYFVSLLDQPLAVLQSGPRMRIGHLKQERPQVLHLDTQSLVAAQVVQPVATDEVPAPSDPQSLMAEAPARLDTQSSMAQMRHDQPTVGEEPAIGNTARPLPPE